MYRSNQIRIFFERNGFAVCSRMAEVLGMKVKSVRLFFIYASFTTLIGGFVLYLTLAFWLKLKDYHHTPGRNLCGLMVRRHTSLKFLKLRYFIFIGSCFL